MLLSHNFLVLRPCTEWSPCFSSLSASGRLRVKGLEERRRDETKREARPRFHALDLSANALCTLCVLGSGRDASITLSLSVEFDEYHK